MLKHCCQYCLCGGRIFFCGLRALLASGFPQFLLVCSQHSQHVSRAILAHWHGQSLVVFCFLAFLLFFALRCELVWLWGNLWCGQLCWAMHDLAIKARLTSGTCIRTMHSLSSTWPTFYDSAVWWHNKILAYQCHPPIVKLHAGTCDVTCTQGNFCVAMVFSHLIGSLIHGSPSLMHQWPT